MIEKYADILDEISVSEEFFNDKSCDNSDLSNTRFINIKKEMRNSISKNITDDENGNFKDLKAKIIDNEINREYKKTMMNPLTPSLNKNNKNSIENSSASKTRYNYDYASGKNLTYREPNVCIFIFIFD